MITAEKGTGRLILSEHGDPRVACAGMNALSPVLLGLTLPLLAFLVVAPVAVQRSAAIVLIILMFLFAVATVIFVISVFCKGPVAALAVTPGEGSLEIYRAGPFATSRDRVDTDDVAALRIATVYDDDGYAVRIPQIVLEDGAAIDVPILVDESDIRHFSKAMGVRSA